jgi:hypothetical protein
MKFSIKQKIYDAILNNKQTKIFNNAYNERVSETSNIWLLLWGWWKGVAQAN